MVQQWMFGYRRFLRKDVEAGPCDQSVVQCGEQVLLVHNGSAADVDDIGAQVSKLRGVKCVYSLFSDFDLLVHLCCATNNDIDAAIKTIGTIKGVTKVTKASVYKKIKEDFRVQI